MSILHEAPIRTPELAKTEECLTSIKEKRLHSFLLSDFRAIADRPALFDLYRRQTLSHDHLGVEITRNLILQNYVQHKEYILADKFISVALPKASEDSPKRKTNARPSIQFCNQNEAAYFFLHAALVKAILLEYNTAQSYIADAIRRGPGEAVPEFQLFASKLSMLIELLNGGIPTVSNGTAIVELLPYVRLVDCFRQGEIKRFESILHNYAEVFTTDKTLLLASRIRHNVFQMALRRISRCYSRISLADVAEKLNIGHESTSDVHSIVMKAIRDGTIAAKIDVEHQDLVSHELCNSYCTTQPFLELQSHSEANRLFQRQVERAFDAERKPEGSNEAEEEALKKKIEDTNKELVKAIEEGVDSDAEWMD